MAPAPTQTRSEAEGERHAAVEAGLGEAWEVGAGAARRRKAAAVISEPDHLSRSPQRIVGLCDQSVMCWFQVARTAAKSAAPNTRRRRRKTVFSTVTSLRNLPQDEPTGNALQQWFASTPEDRATSAKCLLISRLHDCKRKMSLGRVFPDEYIPNRHSEWGERAASIVVVGNTIDARHPHIAVLLRTAPAVGNPSDV